MKYFILSPNDPKLKKRKKREAQVSARSMKTLILLNSCTLQVLWSWIEENCLSKKIEEFLSITKRSKIEKKKEEKEK